MTLFEECLAALGSYKIVKLFEEKMALAQIKLTEYGRLDLKRYRSYRRITIPELQRLPDFSCYVIYDDAKLPVIKCRFKRVMECLDDVTAASFDTWILSEDYTKIIEFHHSGEINLVDGGGQFSGGLA